ncbi:DUF2490 domain-containing protein [Legionella yabuuchiae]|uniref:DUF2490 domain-containing protein n=1 Tax=Legionella yabuuchiae TaxID=376727 RepID=UPI0013EFBA10|nr:DUF2490 domain-containing protein [Legionella yabuuchiae]
MRIRMLLWLLLALFATNLFANRTLSGTWDSLTFMFDENKPFFYFVELEGRFYNRPEINQSLTRLAAGHRMDDLRFWLGYDYSQSLDSSKRNIQTIWQQVSFNLVDSNSFIWFYYSRFEQRFFSQGHGTALRSRNQGTIIARDFFPKRISPVFVGELFVNVNHPHWVSRKTISQTRYFMGIQKPLTNSMTLTLGYLNINVFREREMVHEHIARVRIGVNFE